MFGIHYQQPTPNHLAAIALLPQGTPVLAIDNVQLLEEIYRNRPDLITILRHHNDAEQYFGGGYSDALTRAKKWFARFIDGTFANYAHGVKLVKCWNEEYSNSHNAADIEQRIWQEKAFAEVWQQDYAGKYPHIKLVLGSAAIGNDMPAEVAKICIDYGHVLSYHAYVGAWNQQIISADGYHYMRWASLDKQYKNQGLDTNKLNWVFTETGPILREGGAAGEHPGEGWKNINVCGGSTIKYVEIMSTFGSSIREWNYQNNNRCLGGVLFTTGGSTQWKQFELKEDALIQVVNGLKHLPAGKLISKTNPPSPNPTPNPNPSPTKYRAVVHVLPQTASWEFTQIVSKFVSNSKGTITYSYDDAVNVVTNKNATPDSTVILHGKEHPATIQQWLKDRGASSKFYDPLIGLELTLPFDGSYPITSKFNDPRSYGKHEGIDWATPLKTPIKPARNGIVSQVIDYRPHGYGLYIVLKHWFNGFPLFTAYGHLDFIGVAVGDKVTVRDIIAHSGTSGNSTGPHLHFNLQVPFYGLDGYIIADVRDPYQYINF